MTDAMSRIERRKMRTRAALLAAGEEQISVAGLSSLSIQTATTRADVAMGTFYNHFANKDDLVEQIVQADAERVTEAIRTMQALASTNPQRVACVPAVYAFRASGEQGWARLAAELWAAGDVPCGVLRDDALVPALVAGIDGGDFQIADMDMAAVSARDVIGGTMRRYATEPADVSEHDLVVHCVTCVLRVFGASSSAIDDATAWCLAHPIDLAVFRNVA